MSTSPSATRPEGSAAEPEAGRGQHEGPAEGASPLRPEPRTAAPRGSSPGERRDPSPQPPERAPSDRPADGDLLIDIPQLSVEELTLELDASLLLNRVKLDAKNLEAGLYAKASFEHLVALAQMRRDHSLEHTARRQQRADMTRARTGLRRLLGARRDACRDLSDSDVEQQLRGVHESAREAHERVTSQDEPTREPQHNGDGGQHVGESEHRHNGDGPSSDSVRERMGHAVAQGAKAAGLTAAGLAGGVLLESRSKPSRKLSSLRRRKRLRAIPGAIAKRLRDGR
jgi:hypothetical protein